ncbi:MAG: hypothetical protein IPJ88_01650 [Myxococcales bacterium]|nr:MAG: hypothetical protein IPJ88_01650 [Myxococcales bacterium]
MLTRFTMSCLVLVSFALLSCSSSRPPRWEQVMNGVSGGSVDNLVFDTQDSDVFFAIATNQIYQSKDHGESWSTLADIELSVSSMALHHTASESQATLFIATEQGLSKSASPYKEWDTIAFDSNSVSKLFIPDQTDDLFIVELENGTVFRSTDAGLSWSEISMPLPVKLMSLDMADTTEGKVMILATRLLDTEGNLSDEGRILRSDDDGQTWQEIDQEVKRLTSTAHCNVDNTLHLFVSSIEKVWTSSDAGQSWNEFQAEQTPGSIESLAVTRDCSEIYLASFDSGLFSANLSANEWQGPLSEGLPGLSTVKNAKGVYLSPEDEPALFYSSRYALFWKATSNSDWTSINDIGGVSIRDINASSGEESILWMSTWGAGFWNYSQQDAQWEQPNATELDEGFGFSVTPLSEGKVILGGWPTVYRGLDAALFEEVGQANLFQVAADPEDPSTLYGATQADILVSRDEGLSWDKASESLEPWELNGSMVKDFRSIAVNPTNPLHLLAGSNGNAVFQSTDGGANWQSLEGETLGNTIITCVVFAGQSLFACAQERGVFVSRDGGVGWAFENSGLDLPGNVNELTYDAQSDTLYLASSTGVFERPSEGSEWKALAANSTPKGDLTNPVIVRMQGKRFLYISSSKKGIHRIELQ